MIKLKALKKYTLKVGAIFITINGSAVYSDQIYKLSKIP